MANLPAFHHIHCSSRFDRTPASLERDLDNWMDQSSLITLTEVARDRRAATLRERGWGYYNARRDTGADECAIAYENKYWVRAWAAARKHTNVRYYDLNGTPCRPIYSANALLRHKGSGHKLLVSVTHMPAHVEGPYHWRTTAYAWQARKRAYLTSLNNWSTYVQTLARRNRADGVLAVSDFNLNLKEMWVRELLRDNFDGYRHAWQRFPSDGASLYKDDPDGSVHPLSSRYSHDRIIDGSLYKGLKVTLEPNLMARVSSSDHRPYKEGFRFAAPNEKADDDTPSGDVRHRYYVWWGFGDYDYDELYDVMRVTEDEVT